MKPMGASSLADKIISSQVKVLLATIKKVTLKIYIKIWTPAITMSNTHTTQISTTEITGI